MYSRSYRLIWVVFAALSIAPCQADIFISVKNGLVRRPLLESGSLQPVFQTYYFEAGDESYEHRLCVFDCEEFRITLKDGTVFSPKDFNQPNVGRREWLSTTQTLVFTPKNSNTPGIPREVVVYHEARPGERWLRKRLTIEMPGPIEVTRLDMERFKPLPDWSGGGDNTPIFCENKGFDVNAFVCLDEKPYCTERNEYLPGKTKAEETWTALSVHYSPGLPRLDPITNKWMIQSKSSIIGLTPASMSIRSVYEQYEKSKQNTPAPAAKTR
ncbi:MAG: hypothetical protein NTX50_10705 [Candidatus Sumerlaeota bacterium]|nr:hypothetical protein [Candidatus Sumerlaeota bacterium]